jgi:hypothetical protein
MRKSLLLFCALLFSVTTATVCRASGNGKCQSSAPRTYEPAPGDAANSTAMHAARNLPATIHSIKINVCSGELQVRHAARGDQMELLINSPGADRSLDQYVRAFSVDGHTAQVDVQVPDTYHPTVTLVVPYLEQPSTEINLGSGHLVMPVGAFGDGSRQLNVGAGSATLTMNGSHGYASLQVNIGMGELKDERPGGSNAHFVVSRTMTGAGKGNLEVNVGAGSVDLKSREE